MTKLEDYLTFKQVAGQLGISRQAVSYAVEFKGIPCLKVGSTKLIKKEHLQYIKARGVKYIIE